MLYYDASKKSLGFSRGPEVFNKEPAMSRIVEELQGALDFQQFSSNVIPSGDRSYQLGEDEKRFNGVYSHQISVTGTGTFEAGVFNVGRGGVYDFATNSSMLVIPSYTAGHSPFDLWHPSSGFLRDGAMWLQSGSPQKFVLRGFGQDRMVGVWDTTTCTFAGSVIWERDCDKVIKISTTQHADNFECGLNFTGTATFGDVHIGGNLTGVSGGSGSFEEMTVVTLQVVENAEIGTTLSVDTIGEYTTDAGVTFQDPVYVEDDLEVDGLLTATDNLTSDSVNHRTYLGLYCGGTPGAGSEGTHCTFVGEYAGYHANQNYGSAFGYAAGRQNTGSSQSAFGFYAGYSNTGLSQSAFGYAAGYLNTGSNQSAFGYYAGHSNTGSNQSAFGYQAGRQNTGSSQSAFGYNAGYLNTGSNQSAFGYNAGYLNTGLYQSAFGYYAGHSNTGSNQSAFGYYAGYLNTGSNQSAFGYQAGRQNTGSSQSAFGYYAGRYNDGASNTAIGYDAFNAFNLDAGSAVSFDYTDVDQPNNRVTCTGHGLGANDTYRNLRFDQGTDTLPGIDDTGIDIWKIVDANTLQCMTDTITAVGIGEGHTLTPQYVYSNSTAVGYNAEPDASNQIQLGNASVTEISSAGLLNLSNVGANQLAGSLNVNTVNEYTGDAGVTIDGVLIKDGLVDGVDVSAIAGTTLTDLLSAAPTTDQAIIAYDLTGTEWDPVNILRWDGTEEALSLGVDAEAIGLEHNLAVGYGAAQNNIGTHVTAIGRRAGYDNGGSAVTVVGRNTGQGNTGSTLTAVGRSAAADNTGTDVTVMGVNAGTSQVGEEICAFGVSAGFENEGNNLTAAGVRAGWRQVGTDVVAIGYEAAYQNGVANGDDIEGVVAVGKGAAFRNQGGSMVALGRIAGYQAVGDSCVCVGRYAGYQMGGDNCVAVGRNSFTTFVPNAGGAKTFDFGDIDAVTDYITIAGHGFGAVGEFIHLYYEEGTLPVTGLDDETVYQCQVIDANTIWSSENITAVGTGTGHTYTPRTVYENSIALGYNAQPDASNQCMIGDSNLTSIKSAGLLALTNAGANQMAGSLNVDAINEYTATAGVTIDTVLIKDGEVDGVDVSAHAGASTQVHGLGAGVSVAGTTGAVTDGHLAEFDSNGDLVDSGETTASFATAGHDHDSDYLALTGGTMAGNINLNGNDVTGVAVLNVDTIDERTGDAGVTIETVLLKDGSIEADDVDVGGTLDWSTESSVAYMVDGEGTGSFAKEFWFEDTGGGVNICVCALDGETTYKLAMTEV